MNKTKYKLGVFHKKNKNWYRNITRHKHKKVDIKKFYDFHRIINALRRRIGKESKRFYKYSRRPPSYPRVDLYHHWRALDFGSTPWVVSTSAGLPFGWPSDRYKQGLKLLASETCKKIIVTGKCALDWQRSKAREEPGLADEVMRKVEILPPAQDLLVSDWNDKPVGQTGPLRLAFVGKGFFRKGGYELVRVVERLHSEGESVELDVVSSLGLWSDIDTEEQDVEGATRIMESVPGIRWHGGLPNQDVLDIFQHAHVGVLPSYLDTYGYTVLEAQACGCPTITTDIKAFPDINPDEVGWRIQIANEECDYRTKEGRHRISDHIEQGLYRILKEILNDRTMVREKGAGALDRIAEEHSPALHGERLRTIYREALGD